MTRTIAMTLTGFMGSLCRQISQVVRISDQIGDTTALIVTKRATAASQMAHVVLPNVLHERRSEASEAGRRKSARWKIGPHEMLWAFLRSCQNAHCLRRQVHLTQEIGETDDQGKSGAREERAHKPP